MLVQPQLTSKISCWTIGWLRLTSSTLKKLHPGHIHAMCTLKTARCFFVCLFLKMLASLIKIPSWIFIVMNWEAFWPYKTPFWELSWPSVPTSHLNTAVFPITVSCCHSVVVAVVAPTATQNRSIRWKTKASNDSRQQHSHQHTP